MEIVKNKVYTITDQHGNELLTFSAIKTLENWNEAKVTTMTMPQELQELFDKVDQCIKMSDVKGAKVYEDQIYAHHLKVAETSQPIIDLQIINKKKIYFKTA